MLNLLIRLCVLTIGLCYATSSCHELQKSQLASLNDRITQMLSSLYTPPQSASPVETTPSEAASSNEYSSPTYEASYLPYHGYPVAPQVIYVSPTPTPQPFPFTLPAPNVGPLPYAIPPTPNVGPLPYTLPPTPNVGLPPAQNVGPLPYGYGLPTPIVGPSPYAVPSPNVGALPYGLPPTNVGPFPYALPTPNAAPATPSPYHHFEAHRQLEPYRGLPIAPKAPNYYEHYPYPATAQYSPAPTPYAPSYPTYQYSREYVSPYPEYRSPAYAPKPVYPGVGAPPPAPYQPQGYLTPYYPPPYYPQPESPPPPYYA